VAFRPVRKGGKVCDRRLAANSVCDVTKGYAHRVGLDGAAFGAYRLRSGFLTSAARKDASVFRSEGREPAAVNGGAAGVRPRRRPVPWIMLALL
jgi:hypothetical protein